MKVGSIVDINGVIGTVVSFKKGKSTIDYGVEVLIHEISHDCAWKHVRLGQLKFFSAFGLHCRIII